MLERLKVLTQTCLEDKKWGGYGCPGRPMAPAMKRAASFKLKMQKLSIQALLASALDLTNRL